jgi:hypothetical protein
MKANDSRFIFVRVPVFALPGNWPGMTPSRLLTLICIRSFCYFRTAANAGFGRCTASLATLGKISGQSRSTLCLNIRWLKKNYLLYAIRQGFNRPNILVPVDYPKAFELACRERGRQEAMRDLEDEAEERQQEAWKENAENAGYRPKKDIQPVGPHSPSDWRDILSAGPGTSAHRTTPPQPVGPPTSYGLDPKNDFFEERSSEEQVSEVEHHRTPPDGVVSGLQPVSQSQEQPQNPTPGKPLGESGVALAEEVKEYLGRLAHRQQPGSGNGREFHPEEWNPEKHREFKKQRGIR